ncbi:hypothetical protein AB0N09_43130 [Streptomyces erythrochromogenes]|uniref:hypothetical protein n=1 Tax=Streptomyces erythrochromogenes TaxID=285574 RepID=UPI0034183E8A
MEPISPLEIPAEIDIPEDIYALYTPAVCDMLLQAETPGDLPDDAAIAFRYYLARRYCDSGPDLYEAILTYSLDEPGYQTQYLDSVARTLGFFEMDSWHNFYTQFKDVLFRQNGEIHTFHELANSELIHASATDSVVPVEHETREPRQTPGTTDEEMREIRAVNRSNIWEGKSHFTAGTIVPWCFIPHIRFLVGRDNTFGNHHTDSLKAMNHAMNTMKGKIRVTHGGTGPDRRKAQIEVAGLPKEWQPVAEFYLEECGLPVYFVDEI